MDQVSDIDWINSFLPAAVAKAWRGVGSFITFDFESKKEPETEEALRSIWIYLADWYIDTENTCEEILNSDCVDNEKYEAVLSRFEGARLSLIEEEDDCVFLTFDNNLGVSIIPNEPAYGRGQQLVIFYFTHRQPYALIF